MYRLEGVIAASSSSEIMDTEVPGIGRTGARPRRMHRLMLALALAVLAAVPALAGSVRLRRASDRKPAEIYLAPDPEPLRP